MMLDKGDGGGVLFELGKDRGYRELTSDGTPHTSPRLRERVAMGVSPLAGRFGIGSGSQEGTGTGDEEKKQRV